MQQLFEIENSSIYDWLDFYNSQLYDKNYIEFLNVEEFRNFFNILLGNDFSILLFQAIDKYNENYVEKLIKNGVDVNIKDAIGNTPLLYTIKKISESNKYIKKLISFQNNNNEIEHFVYSMKQKFNQLLVIFNLILKNGSNIYITDNIGNSSIKYIIQKKNKIEELSIIQKYIERDNRIIKRIIKKNNKLYSDIIYEINKFI
jgi:hypothetical protein